MHAVCGFPLNTCGNDRGLNGYYDYMVTFKDSGGVGAEGQKTWTVKAYKWRVH